MLRRFGVNYAIFSIGLDIFLTLLALFLATRLVSQVPAPLTNLRGRAFVSPYIYLAVPLLWGVAFLILSVYDPKRIYRSIDELQLVTVATIASALVFAGLLYLAQRDFSRWVFILFVTLDLSFLLGWRILARILFRVRRLPAAERRVLIVGAGVMLAGFLPRHPGPITREYAERVWGVEPEDAPGGGRPQAAGA